MTKFLRQFYHFSTFVSIPFTDNCGRTLNFWKACTIALEYSRGSGYSGLLTRNLSIARITSSLVITTQLNFAKTIPPHLIIEYVITPFNYTKEFIFLPLLSFSISMFLYCIRISLFPYI